MIFVDEYNKVINHYHLEREEQKICSHFIKSNDVVLELGARYGTVSCTINKKLNYSSNQVSVEPDSRVWEALEKNKKNNECNFKIIKGFISKRRLNLTNLNDYFGGYGATSTEDEKSKIPIYQLKDIQSKFKLNFNTLVADCEGFLGVFLQENPQIYKNFSKIIFEADYPDKCDYDEIYRNLSKNNFKKILKGHQNVFLK